MKKILARLVIFLLLITNVYAKDNRLYINENGKKIFYESKYFDKDVFMNHTKMMPGEEYVDELVIENNSKKDLDVLLKMNDGSEENKLLDYIDIVITLDDSIIYEGMIQGEDLDDGEIDLGKFAPGDKAVLKVTSSLSKDYNPYSDRVFNINWTFYVKEAHKPKVPIVGGSSFVNLIKKIIGAILLILSLIFLLFGVRLVLSKRKNGMRKSSILRSDDYIEILSEDFDDDDDLEVLTEEDKELDIEIPVLNYKVVIDDSRDVIDAKSKLPSEDGNLILNIHIDGLDKLKNDDKVYITYNRTRYTYKLLNIYNIAEDGFVEVDNNSERNTLTIMDINKDGVDYIAIFYLA